MSNKRPPREFRGSGQPEVPARVGCCGRGAGQTQQRRAWAGCREISAGGLRALLATDGLLCLGAGQSVSAVRMARSRCSQRRPGGPCAPTIGKVTTLASPVPSWGFQGNVRSTSW